MNEYLKETLIMQAALGIDASFDFVAGRPFLGATKNNNVNQKNTKENDNLLVENSGISNNNQDNILPSNKKICINDGSNVFLKNGLSQALEDIKTAQTIEDVENKIKKFEGCLLKKQSTNSVIFDGNTKANIVLIGEAPGENEDLQGTPFCGQSGKLLRKALSFIDLQGDKNEIDKSNLFITNCIFWRPPENRKPTQDEIMICLPFVLKMLEIIKPKIVILCGSTAINFFLQTTQKTGQMVGKFEDINIEKLVSLLKISSGKNDITFELEKNIKTFAIYHPSYLLRNPIIKKTFWQHLFLLKSYLDENKVLCK